MLGALTALAQPPAVSLEAETDRKYYREHARSEVHVEARVTAASGGIPVTPAVRNIALVLDRSGSMAGEPIAEMRRAVAKAIGVLADEDFVAVVLFGSEVETLIESQRRGQIRDLEARLAQLEPAGGASLYDALNQAAAQLRRHTGPATIDHLILLTDGPPTKGPRESEDFTKLAEVFGREGIVVSALGLGAEFNEDMLSAMARAAHGNFRYVATPGKIAAALEAELKPRPAVLGREVVLTVEFKRLSSALRSYGWRAPTMGETSMTFRFPRLLSDRPLAVLVSSELEGFDARHDLPDFATVRVRWKAVESEEERELTRVIPVNFSSDTIDLRESLNVRSARTGAVALIRDGLQKAIEALDKNDARRALRMLRTARTEARDLNYDFDDAQINETVRLLDGYLAEVQRPGATIERKVLRSGLLNLFDPPSTLVEAKR